MLALAAVRMLHDAAAAPWPGQGLEEIASHLDGESILTLGHEEDLADVVVGYGTGVHLEVIRARGGRCEACA